MTRLLELSRAYVLKRENNIAVEHAVFGWFSGTVSRGLHDVMQVIVNQIRFVFVCVCVCVFVYVCVYLLWKKEENAKIEKTENI